MEKYDPFVEKKIFENRQKLSFCFRTNSNEVQRQFGLMRIKIHQLYDELDLAMANGDIENVLRIEEQLKLIR